jgi:hypothetical protein
MKESLLECRTRYPLFCGASLVVDSPVTFFLGRHSVIDEGVLK